jgi:hypothetical protein
MNAHVASQHPPLHVEAGYQRVHELTVYPLRNTLSRAVGAEAIPSPDGGRQHANKDQILNYHIPLSAPAMFIRPRSKTLTAQLQRHAKEVDFLPVER